MMFPPRDTIVVRIAEIIVWVSGGLYTDRRDGTGDAEPRAATAVPAPKVLANSCVIVGEAVEVFLSTRASVADAVVEHGLHAGIGRPPDFVDRTQRGYSAFGQDHNTIGNFESALEFVGNDDDRHSERIAQTDD